MGEREEKVIELERWLGIDSRSRRLLTGIPAVHGEEAVAALDNELVDPYLTRPDAVRDGSLIVSDATKIPTVKLNWISITLNEFHFIQ